MKKLFISALLVTLSLGLTACNKDKIEPSAAELYMATWDAVLSASESQSCPKLKKLMTDRINPTKDDCLEIYTYIETESLTPMWDNIEWEERGENAQIRVPNEATGRTLVLLRKDNGDWKVDNIFWR